MLSLVTHVQLTALLLSHFNWFYFAGARRIELKVNVCKHPLVLYRVPLLFLAV